MGEKKLADLSKMSGKAILAKILKAGGIKKCAVSLGLKLSSTYLTKLYAQFPKDFWFELFYKYKTIKEANRKTGITCITITTYWRKFCVPYTTADKRNKIAKISNEVIQEAINDGGSLRGAAQILNLPYASIAGRVQREPRGTFDYDHRHCSPQQRKTMDIYAKFEALANELETFREQFLREANELHQKWFGDYRLLIMSDLHGYYLRDDLIKEAVKQAKAQKPKELPLRIVLVGDIFNFDIFSHFVDFAEIPSLQMRARAETVRVEKTVRFLLDNCDKLMFLPGNHDRRPYKKLARSLGSEAAKFVTENAPLLGWAINALGSQYFMPDITASDRNKIDIAPSYFQRIADVFVAHPHRFSGAVLMRTAQWFDSWLQEQVLRPFKGVFIAHSHRLGMVQTRRFLAEIGCMCKPMPYTLRDSRAGMESRWIMGYGFVVVKDTKADLNTAYVRQLDQGCWDV